MRLRVLSVVAALYSAQFIPLFFTVMALPIIMRTEGHSATTIGLVQLAGLPYVFKFLWAPLIDRYRIGTNRYKSWIVVLSTIHIVAVLALAFTDPSGSLVPLFIALFIATLSVSTQDVAVDALVISILRASERTLGSTFQNIGAYIGGIVGGFLFLYLFGKIGWTAALLIQAVIFCIPLFSLLLVDEPPRVRGMPAVTFKNAFKFFGQKRIWPWLGVLATMRIPLIMTMLPIRLMMVDQGMTTEEIALWFGLFAMSAGGGATALAGPILRNIPRVAAVYTVGLINIPVLIAVAYLSAAFPDAIRYAIVFLWMAIAATDIVMFRGAMDKTRPEMPGFDFSVQIAIYMLVASFLEPVVGYAIDTQGYLFVYLASIPLTLVPLAILYFSIARIKDSIRGLDGDRSVSTGHIKTAKVWEMIRHFEEEVSEAGIECSWPEPNLLQMEAMGCIVKMKAHNNALDVLIDTPTENYLIFIREFIVEHLDEIDRPATDVMQWTGGIRPGEIPSNIRVLRASRRSEVHPGLIRVTLEGIDVEAMAKDGIHIRLMMPLKRGRQPVWPKIGENGGTVWPQGDDKLHSRTVTVRNIRIDQREIDIDIAHHADGGLIAQWAALEGDDQEVGVMGPVDDNGLDFVDNVILASDTTGLPAIARLIESVEGRATGYVFAEAPSQEALEAYLPKSDLVVTAIPPNAFGAEIADRISTCTNQAVTYAWFAGEFSLAQKVRKVFKGHFGLGKGEQLSVAYWKNGEPGYHA